MGNALNFTDTGHVTLNVVLAKREQRNLVIKITVTDSGTGIPKDKQQEIYIQFKRLTHSYQGIYKGAGLGLYVVKLFIADLGGTTRMKYACQYVERYWKSGERILFEPLYHQTVKTIEDTCNEVTQWLKVATNYI